MMVKGLVVSGIWLLLLFTIWGVGRNHGTIIRMEAKLDRIIDYQGLNEVVAE